MMDDPNKLDELFNNYITQRLRGGLHIAYGMLYVQVSLVFPYFFYMTLCLGVLAYYIYLCEECGHMIDFSTYEIIKINANSHDPVLYQLPTYEYMDSAYTVDKYIM